MIIRGANMFEHKTVLLEEAVNGLKIDPDGIYVDCTLGGAGHSSYIASKLSNKGKLYAFDQDDVAIENAKAKLAKYGDIVTIIKSNFANITDKLHEQGVTTVDGILFDLGVSSHNWTPRKEDLAITTMPHLICEWIKMQHYLRMTS